MSSKSDAAVLHCAAQWRKAQKSFGKWCRRFAKDCGKELDPRIFDEVAPEGTVNSKAAFVEDIRKSDPELLEVLTTLESLRAWHLDVLREKQFAEAPTVVVESPEPDPKRRRVLKSCASVIQKMLEDEDVPDDKACDEMSHELWGSSRGSKDNG